MSSGSEEHFSRAIWRLDTQEMHCCGFELLESGYSKVACSLASIDIIAHTACAKCRLKVQMDLLHLELQQLMQR